VTGVQTCALPILLPGAQRPHRQPGRPGRRPDAHQAAAPAAFAAAAHPPGTSPRRDRLRGPSAGRAGSASLALPRSRVAVRHDAGMAEMDWSTREGLAAIREHLAARIDGYAPPVAYAVGITPASSSAEIEFPYVNAPGGQHGLPAVILATILGHTSGTRTYDVSLRELVA